MCINAYIHITYTVYYFKRPTNILTISLLKEQHQDLRSIVFHFLKNHIKILFSFFLFSNIYFLEMLNWTELLVNSVTRCMTLYIMNCFLSVQTVMSSLEKCLFKFFAHFLIGLFVFLEWSRVSLYILEIKLLSEVSQANRFSHTVGSLFILMLFSLAVQKLFILMRSHLFTLSFMSLTLGDILVKILLYGISEILPQIP